MLFLWCLHKPHSIEFGIKIKITVKAACYKFPLLLMEKVTYFDSKTYDTTIFSMQLHYFCNEHV